MKWLLVIVLCISVFTALCSGIPPPPPPSKEKNPFGIARTTVNEIPRAPPLPFKASTVIPRAPPPPLKDSETSGKIESSAKTAPVTNPEGATNAIKAPSAQAAESAETAIEQPQEDLLTFKPKVDYAPLIYLALTKPLHDMSAEEREALEPHLPLTPTSLDKLVWQGAEPGYTDKSTGQTPLHQAKDMQTLGMLLAHLNIRTLEVPDNRGQKAIDGAMEGIFPEPPTNTSKEPLFDVILQRNFHRDLLGQGTTETINSFFNKYAADDASPRPPPYPIILSGIVDEIEPPTLALFYHPEIFSRIGKDNQGELMRGFVLRKVIDYLCCVNKTGMSEELRNVLMRIKETDSMRFISCIPPRMRTVLLERTAADPTAAILHEDLKERYK